MRRNYEIEVCANSLESAWAAQAGGADRVELCAGMPEGGTTPSIGTIRLACERLSLRVHPIIRLRGGDFLYTKEEIEIMEEDIRQAVAVGAQGVVVGCLCADGRLDLPSLRRLIDAAEGRSVTLHRAFDYVLDPFRAIDELIDLGVERILTSGQAPTAMQGIAMLKQCVEYAEDRIKIMVGCGVNEVNIATLAQETGATAFHFSARIQKKSAMQVCNEALYMGNKGIDEYTTELTSVEKVKTIIQALCGQQPFGL